MPGKMLTAVSIAAVVLCASLVFRADLSASVQTARRGADDAVEHERHGGDHPAAPATAPAGAPAQSPAGDPAAKALFEAKCSICHPLSRPLGRTKDLGGWTTTVTRMQRVNGCPITDQEAKTIIGYLVSVRGPGAK